MLPFKGTSFSFSPPLFPSPMWLPELNSPPGFMGRHEIQACRIENMVKDEHVIWHKSLTKYYDKHLFICCKLGAAQSWLG